MNKAMLTDLYELTMMAAYLDSRKDDPATFDLSIRTLPEGWGYYIANGIEDAIDCLTGMPANYPLETAPGLKALIKMLMKQGGH